MEVTSDWLSSTGVPLTRLGKSAPAVWALP
jgi:hypothetical protein